MIEQDEKEIRIREYLSGELSEAGRQEFREWLAKDMDVRRIFKEQVKQMHLIRWAEHWDVIDEETARRQVVARMRQRRLRIGFVRYAAVVVVMLVAGLVIWAGRYQSKELPVLAVVSTPVVNVPVLKLANGKEIPISSRNTEIIRSTRRVDIQLADSGRLEYVAKSDSIVGEVEYNTLVVPQGCEFNIVLADGSRVWLNAGSSLRYPEAFSRDERKVFLSGEAYFEVEHDESTPFIVNTEVMDLQVLGTSFNIKAYDNENTVVTTLVSGKIRQEFPNVGKKIVLTPSRQSVFDRVSGKLETKQADIQETLAWREGKIIANNERLEDIFRQLSRWYDFKVVYTLPSLKDIRFYLHSNRYAEVRTILEHLQTTKGIRFTYAENTIYVSQ
ncbi:MULTISPECIES: FecR domain-containing protein [Butyricimonas]|uniref:FecR domain-containing protein n=1 Tax=Butyricimonas virosa TaxID=544645 RepID=A0ABX7H6I8_9BACT|nr:MULTISPECIES: FecR domain-containing protein [Butyricimonas]MBO4959446.1 FecR domain-containing protein [Butyricimonas sp.]MCI7292670.1 FecR domain-containing protein [Butyricimonas virosa]MDY6219666.1 FecR domain-containing protein [Butyricimonas virosa]QRO50672.1 FecR domain-containing protein [Butyricimonas virosa]UWO48618.1 FecR domain-containing protein [Butyricimonas virosa]